MGIPDQFAKQLALIRIEMKIFNRKRVVTIATYRWVYIKQGVI